MAITAIERLVAERNNIRKDRGFMFYARPVERDKKIDMFEWDCGFPGIGTHSDGYFKVKLFFLEDFPFSPPAAKFVHPIYHPNVYPNNVVCLDLLGRRWKPSLSINNIIHSLQRLLVTPNINSPANQDAANDFKCRRKIYLKKVQLSIEKYHTSHKWIKQGPKI